jgi:hypothetical protein
VENPGIFTWNWRGQISCETDEGGNLGGDFEVVGKKVGDRGRSILWRKVVRLGFRKGDIMAYRNLLGVNFRDLEKALFSIFLIEKLFRFFRKKPFFSEFGGC